MLINHKQYLLRWDCRAILISDFDILLSALRILWSSSALIFFGSLSIRRNILYVYICFMYATADLSTSLTT